jgi:DNA-binding transcriptional ArsR family regulator
VVTLVLSVADLASLRFGISPVWELVASLRVLHRPGAHAVHLPWVRRTRRVLTSEEDLEQLRVLATAQSIVGFLAPTPSTLLGAPDDELAAVARTAPDVVRRSVREVFGTRAPRAVDALIAEPEEGLERLVEQMRRYWTEAIEPYWPRVMGVLEGDVAHRGRELAEHGPERMFGDLDPTVAWHDGRLTLDKPHLAGRSHELAGRGLVLVPSLFAWPALYLKADTAWQPVIRYPARRIGALWEALPAGDELAAALGTSRAALLALLDAPATTSELARATGLAPGGVSAHLARLVRSGLATRHRRGRTVVYLRTPRGDALFR